jgi:choline dehydrogenase-like flavoprotein
MAEPLSADVVVVGSGSGGAVVARRLVDAGVGVVLVEAGGADENPAIHDPPRLSLTRCAREQRGSGGHRRTLDDTHRDARAARVVSLAHPHWGGWDGPRSSPS